MDVVFRTSSDVLMIVSQTKRKERKKRERERESQIL